ncbi:MAG: gliding motility-associated ABC transporter substrate-binding protein GldG [Bacteroidetes bacterium]|nr:gliding motility-associated ABC transporter substrate-binding protein GldG [Bacteroidota bacterium]
MKKLLHWILVHRLGVALALLLFFLLNILASLSDGRLDLTEEKRYTLEEATRQQLQALNEPIEVTVFLKGEFPSGFKKLATSTDQFLSLLQKQNPSRFHYRFVSPLEEVSEGKLWGDSLLSMGALNINLTVQKEAGQSSNILFPVALVEYRGQQSLVTLLPGASRAISQTELNRAEALLEFQFTSVIDKLVHPRKPGIAYEIGHGEPTDQRTYQLRVALQKDYELRTLDLTRQPAVPAGVDLLLLVKPTLRFSENEKLKIDQFVMRGGKLLCFIDNLVAEMDSFGRKPSIVAFDRDLNLGDLFFRYGARINPDLVMDLRCEVSYIQVGGTTQQPQNEFLPWNYYPLVGAPAADKKLKTAGYVGLRFANSIDTVEAPGVTKTPLLASSERARIISTPALISLNENSTVPENKLFNRGEISVAMLLEGQLNSLYRNRIFGAKADSMTRAGQPFIPQATQGGVLLVADGDLVLNDYIPAVDEKGAYDPQAPLVPTEMGWNPYTHFEYLTGGEAGRYFMPVANKEFLLNSVEYLISNPAISGLRAKEITLRLLDGEKVNQYRLWVQLLFILFPLLLLVGGGVLFQSIRKRKFAR